MEPNFYAGQTVLVSGVPYLFSPPKVGHVIVFSNQAKKIIKRIRKIEGKKYLMVGDNKNDSRNFGFVERSKIVGKVIYKL